MMDGVSRVEGYLSTALILTHKGARDATRAGPLAHIPFGSSGLSTAEEVREIHERRSRRDKRPRRSHDRYFFFVNAGPKSGLTWQFWILPTHIESSWRP
jgi:hypothetical protein